MTLQDIAKDRPETRVRLLFKSGDAAQTGTLETTIAHALNPNASQRYFPPSGETAASLGWPVPYWYASEVTGIAILDGPYKSVTHHYQDAAMTRLSV